MDELDEVDKLIEVLPQEHKTLAFIVYIEAMHLYQPNRQFNQEQNYKRAHYLALGVLKEYMEPKSDS